MDPMQQPPVQPNPYDFIHNPQKPPKQPLIGGSTKSRAIFVGVIVLVLIVVAVVVSSVFSSLANAGTSQLKTVYAEQQELIRLAEIGLKDAVGPDTRGFAGTTLLSTRTSQQKIQSVLSSRGVKITPQEAAAKKNARAEEILTGAAANNRYDETMQELLEERISSYNNSLRAAYDANDSQQARDALNEAFSGAGMLISKTE